MVNGRSMRPGWNGGGGRGGLGCRKVSIGIRVGREADKQTQDLRVHVGFYSKSCPQGVSKC